MTQRHRDKRLKAWRYLLAFPCSIWWNFRLLPLRQAVRMPLLVSHRTCMSFSHGSLRLDAVRPKVGLVKIGFATSQCSDFRHDRTRLDVHGLLHVAGYCAIGAGCSIEVSENATLTLGDDFHLGPRSLVICHRQITFGTHTLTSWNCSFMDTDQHELVDDGGRCVNADRPVGVGDGCWFGCHSIVTKGVVLAPRTTVGAASHPVGCYDEPDTVIAGNPAKVVRRGVHWSGR